MDIYSALQYVLFLAIVTALVEPLGGYLNRVFAREPTALDRLCLPLERLIYRVTAVDPDVEMSSPQYAICFVFFGLAGTLLLYAILRLQPFLPWFFPEYQTTALSPDLAAEYGDQFLDHYHLAGVRRRDHHELLQPDGGSLRTELSWRVPPDWRSASPLSAVSRGNSRTRWGTSGSI